MSLLHPTLECAAGFTRFCAVSRSTFTLSLAATTCSVCVSVCVLCYAAVLGDGCGFAVCRKL